MGVIGVVVVLQSRQEKRVIFVVARKREDRIKMYKAFAPGIRSGKAPWGVCRR